MPYKVGPQANSKRSLLKKNAAQAENIQRLQEKYLVPESSKSQLLMNSPYNIDNGLGRSTGLSVPGFAHDHDTEYAQLTKKHNQ